jgi:hypothetical protein
MLYTFLLPHTSHPAWSAQNYAVNRRGYEASVFAIIFFTLLYSSAPSIPVTALPRHALAKLFLGTCVEIMRVRWLREEKVSEYLPGRSF